jgi:hypothetical protein
MQVFMLLFVSRIESYTQGGPVAFYKELSSKNVYVKSLFKSYADLFYSRKKPSAPPESADKNWLLEGPIDRSAYFVARSTQARRYDDPRYGLKKLKEEFGFVYYVRDPSAIVETGERKMENSAIPRF